MKRHLEIDRDHDARVAPTPTPGDVVLSLRHEPLRFYLELARRYGDVVKYEDAPGPRFLFSHPDAVRHVLVTRADRYEATPAHQSTAADADATGELGAALAGADGATTHAVARTLRLLATHPAEARRVRAEVDAVLAGRAARREDLPALAFTRMALEEALRLDPLVGVLTLRALADDEVIGVRVPAGAAVTVSPYVVQRHPAFWPEPEVFDPERFAAGEPRHAYFPFGAVDRGAGRASSVDDATLRLATTVARLDVDVDDRGALRATPRAGLPPTA